MIPQRFDFPDLYRGDTYQAMHFTISAVSAANANMEYTWSSTTTDEDPGTGTILFNHATLSSVTQINISETDGESTNRSSELATWDDAPSTFRARIKICKANAPSNYVVYDVNAAQTDAGSYRTFPVTYVTHNGSFDDGDDLLVTAAVIVDLTGATPLIQLRRNDRLYHTFTCQLSGTPTDGKFSILPETIDIAPGVYNVDVQITQNGVTNTYLRGECTVIQDVSQE